MKADNDLLDLKDIHCDRINSRLRWAWCMDETIMEGRTWEASINDLIQLSIIRAWRSDTHSAWFWAAAVSIL